ncbi:MAG: four helix bundle protein [Bacteroidetes bacterium]|jgi:four helix bundle protein|nr:four helix bundle protein [Bacteroidota bacterium]
MEKKLGYAGSFKELEVYKQTRELARIIFELTKTFPKEEKYSLTDQIRRSSRSVGAQIAESWGKRRYEKHFISKMTDADAEQYETQHWIEVAYENRYIDQNTKLELIDKCEGIGKMIGSIIDKSFQFCKKYKTVS